MRDGGWSRLIGTVHNLTWRDSLPRALYRITYLQGRQESWSSLKGGRLLLRDESVLIGRLMQFCSCWWILVSIFLFPECLLDEKLKQTNTVDPCTTQGLEVLLLLCKAMSLLNPQNLTTNSGLLTWNPH